MVRMPKKIISEKKESGTLKKFEEYYGDMVNTRKQSRREDRKKDAEYIQQFIPLVKFLGEVLGHDTEVVLHDASRPDQSIIAISNGHVSGRTVGSPATDLMLKVMREGISNNKDYVVGYDGKTSQSKYKLISSTFFIRRDANIIGSLCINTDQSAIHSLKLAVERINESYFPKIKTQNSDQPSQEETLIASVDDIVAEVISQISIRTGVQASRLSTEQRLAVFRELCDRGYFSFKGAISKVSKQLQISESTAYRYLRIVQES